MLEERFSSLEISVDDVAKMTRSQREQRVEDLLVHSNWLVDTATEIHLGGKRELAATCILYSGGNDSTTLAHIFKDRADYAIHANTGIGIEQTREFVKETCASWELPLIIKHPPAGSTYRELVLDRGFPGPGQHWKMYQRLKERCLRQARADLVKNPRRERVVFLAGRRRTESARRSDIPSSERVGSTIWISPLVYWTKLDLNTYRLMQGDVPANQVSDLIHMSGECLCGSFAKKGELEEIGMWFPEIQEQIEELEALIADREDIPVLRRKWGWGRYIKDVDALMARGKFKSGPMCSSCDARATGGEAIAV